MKPALTVGPWKPVTDTEPACHAAAALYDSRSESFITGCRIDGVWCGEFGSKISNWYAPTHYAEYTVNAPEDTP